MVVLRRRHGATIARLVVHPAQDEATLLPEAVVDQAGSDECAVSSLHVREGEALAACMLA